MRKISPFAAKILTYILFAAAALLAVISLDYIGAKAAYILLGISILLCVAAYITDSMFYRCPKCGGYLGRGISKHCSHCGEKIGD